MYIFFFFVCFFKQKTAYEMRISDWSSDVCSSDLGSKLYTFTVQATDGQRIAFLHARGDVVSEEDAGEGAMGPQLRLQVRRSEERRVGKECVRTCRSRWSSYH